VFKCLAKPCKGKGRNPRCVNRFLDKKDAKSTGNLQKHARLCWGDETKDILAACEAVKKKPAERWIVNGCV
jgi:hypothetical protein